MLGNLSIIFQSHSEAFYVKNLDFMYQFWYYYHWYILNPIFYNTLFFYAQIKTKPKEVTQ